MNLEILPLQDKILKRLSSAAQKGQIDEVTRLSGMAAKTKTLQADAERIASEIKTIERDLVTAPVAPMHDELEDILKSLGKRQEKATIEVTIDWNRNGKPFGSETVTDSIGSRMMARLFERLAKVMGSHVLEIASRIRVKRGPMISKNPQADYLNRATGRPYGYREIPGTGYSVLTGTDSDQKVSDLNVLFKAIGLTDGSYSVRKLAPDSIAA